MVLRDHGGQHLYSSSDGDSPLDIRLNRGQYAQNPSTITLQTTKRVTDYHRQDPYDHYYMQRLANNSHHLRSGALSPEQALLQNEMQQLATYRVLSDQYEMKVQSQLNKAILDKNQRKLPPLKDRALVPPVITATQAP